MDNDVDGACSFYDSNTHCYHFWDIETIVQNSYLIAICCVQPGLAFFYGGLVPRKSVLTIMMQVIGRQQ